MQITIRDLIVSASFLITIVTGAVTVANSKAEISERVAVLEAITISEKDARAVQQTALNDRLDRIQADIGQNRALLQDLSHMYMENK